MGVMDIRQGITYYLCVSKSMTYIIFFIWKFGLRHDKPLSHTPFKDGMLSKLEGAIKLLCYK